MKKESVVNIFRTRSAISWNKSLKTIFSEIVFCLKKKLWKSWKGKSTKWKLEKEILKCTICANSSSEMEAKDYFL